MKKLILNRTLFLVFFAGIVWGQIPQAMSYQGVLKTSSGAVVADGNYPLAFNLYDVSTAGTALWSETHATVAVSDGVFNIILGSVTSLNLAFDKQYWLGVKVGTDSELSPRIKLTASPYTLNAQAVLGSSNIFPSSGSVGIGTTGPETLLHVKDASSQPILRIDGGAIGKPKLQFYGQGKEWAIRHDDVGASYGLIFTNESNAVDVLSMDPLGNVGIGTTSPDFLLHVEKSQDTETTIQIKNIDGNVSASATLRLVTGTTGAGESKILKRSGTAANPNELVIWNERDISLETAAGQFMVKYEGNVGIGTTTPSGLLTVRGSTQGVTLNIFGAGNFVDLARLDFDGLNNLSNQKTYASVRAELGSWTSGSETGKLIFSTINSGTLSERMRIIETGNVGIGTTSPSTALDVVGTVTATDFVGDGSGLTNVLKNISEDTTPELGGDLYVNSFKIRSPNVPAGQAASNIEMIGGIGNSAGGGVSTLKGGGIVLTGGQSDNSPGGDISITSGGVSVWAPSGSISSATLSGGVVDGSTGSSGASVVAMSAVSSGGGNTTVVGGTLELKGGDGNSAAGGDIILIPGSGSISGNVGISTTSPSSTFEVNGSFATSAIRTEASDYTVSATDYIILASTNIGQTITLPSAVGIAGRRYIIKKTGSPAMAVNINPATPETIDGNSTILLMNPYQSVEIISDGANWFKISYSG